MPDADAAWTLVMDGEQLLVRDRRAGEIAVGPGK